VSNLDGWTGGQFEFAGVVHPTYRRGRGRGVIVVHEIPGLTPRVIAFANEVVTAGFTVVMPDLFGTPGARPNKIYEAKSLIKVCISREFTTWQTNRTSPIVDWLRALARNLQDETGGRRVGAVGMCLTAGFALAMMADEAVVTPVMAQPSVPIAAGKRRRADLGLSPTDLAAIRTRCAAGARVLGLQYEKDWRTGTRFHTLERELGKNFIRVNLKGRGHSTLTEDRDESAVARVIAFLQSAG
jgi:dienelactone hydrolase